MGWLSSKKSQPQPPPSTVDGPAAPTAPPDFDALAAAGRERKHPRAMEDLWEAVFRLPAWHFIPRGGTDDPTPLAINRDGRGHVLAFTDKDRAHAFAVLRGLKQGDGYGVLSMEFPGAAEYCARLRDAAAIEFNTGPNGFFAAVANMLPMLSYERPDLVHAGFDPALRLVGLKQARRTEALAQHFRALFSAEAWWAVEFPSRPGTPFFFERNGGLIVVFFSSEASALAAVERMGLSRPDAPAGLLRHHPASFVGWCKSTADQGLRYASFDIATAPVSIPIQDLPGFVADFAPK